MGNPDLRVLSIPVLSWRALPSSEVGKELGGDAGPNPEYPKTSWWALPPLEVREDVGP